MSLTERQQTILEEKYAEFGGGISQGSLRVDAILRAQKIMRSASAIRRQTVAARPRPTTPAVRVDVPRIKRPGTLQPVSRPAAVLPRGDPIEPRSAPVSIWTDLGGILRGAVTQRVSQAVGPRPVIQPGPIPAQASVASLGVAGRVLPAIGRIMTGRVATGVGIGAAAATIFMDAEGRCPVGFHPAKDGSGKCVRNRRMNFGNARAARRSVRRLKGARKLLQDIEKMMPRRAAPRRRDPHHHHPAAGRS